MTEIEIKEHYIFKMLLQAVLKNDEIVIKHRDFYPYKIHIADHRRVGAVSKQPDCIKLTIADLEQLVGHPVVIVSDRSNATHVLEGGDKHNFTDSKQ